MKRIIAVAVTVLLAGCTGAQIQQSLQTVDTIARGACGFAPAIDTAIGELNADVGVTAQAAATAICAAVNTVTVTAPGMSAAPSARPVAFTKRGTQVKGCWVRGAHTGRCL